MPGGALLLAYSTSSVSLCQLHFACWPKPADARATQYIIVIRLQSLQRTLLKPHALYGRSSDLQHETVLVNVYSADTCRANTRNIFLRSDSFTSERATNSSITQVFLQTSDKMFLSSRTMPSSMSFVRLKISAWWYDGTAARSCLVDQVLLAASAAATTFLAVLSGWMQATCCG